MENEIITIIIKSIGIFVATVYIGSLFWVWLYERKINKLHERVKEEIEDAKKMGMPMSFINGRINKIKENYNPKIEELERKRRFILEKLPFIKK